MYVVCSKIMNWLKQMKHKGNLHGRLIVVFVRVTLLNQCSFFLLFILFFLQFFLGRSHIIGGCGEFFSFRFFAIFLCEKIIQISHNYCQAGKKMIKKILSWKNQIRTNNRHLIANLNDDDDYYLKQYVILNNID